MTGIKSRGREKRRGGEERKRERKKITRVIAHFSKLMNRYLNEWRLHGGEWKSGAERGKWERDGAVVEQKRGEGGFADLSSRSRWMRRFIDVGPLSETRSSVEELVACSKARTLNFEPANFFAPIGRMSDYDPTRPGNWWKFCFQCISQSLKFIYRESIVDWSSMRWEYFVKYSLISSSSSS